MNKKNLDHINQTGFKVPKDYFENFEDAFLSELNLKEKVSHPGFKVPEGYFQTLDDQILKAVKTNEDGKLIKLFPWKKLAYASSIAASLIILFNVTFNKNEVLSIDNIETTSIENYILTEGLESTEITSLFTDKELSEITLTNNNLNSETLENYVLDNIEIEDILTEY